MDKIFSELKSLALSCDAVKLVLFGSRARGDHTQKSDIDIAVFGLTPINKLRFVAGATDISTLLKIDVVCCDKNTSPELLKNINRDGVILMDKLKIKLANFESAILRLKEAIDEHAKTHSTVARDGAIQRFEFTAELAWKSTREYLLDQNHTDIDSPKSTMKQAFISGLITDEIMWLSLLNDRNATSHIYDEQTANDVYARISKTYVILFEQLIMELK